ncbi:MAG: FapA family protein [Sedimentibacter sp.]|uniref:DUF342 domain-containing protein n=1 Tax=Sedimentibacter sp. TaxID=1960295 RepID=UPI003158BA1C
MEELNSTQNIVMDGDMLYSGDEQPPKYNINHLVSANKLKVYIRVELLDKEASIGSDEIFDYLDEQGIVYGIRKDDISKYCENREYTKELAAACGKEPINGTDAVLVYDFETSKELKFTEKEDGSIDFRNLNNVVNVKKGDVLCHIIPAQKGVDGIDVYGQEIAYRKGKEVSFSHGNNTCVSDDGLSVLATADGSAEITNGKVYVESVYKVENVDNETGNIDFIGNVVINGDVKAGFSVISKGDIKIRGMVEGAHIRAGGDVVIGKGMNGMGRGTIYARGNITSKYIENAAIESEKCIYAEALINSDVKAGESIMLRGSNAAIIGGTSQAENMIYAKTIGSKTNAETNLVINLDRYMEEQKSYTSKKKLNDHLEKELDAKNKELKDIDERTELINSSFMDDNSKNNVKKQLIFMKIKINNEIQDLKRQLTDMAPTDNIANHKIVCKGVMYANTRISIGWMKHRVRQDISYSKIYNDGNDIAVIPLNPSDIEQ